MAKKFRVRFKNNPSSSEEIQPGEIFIEKKSLGTTVLKTNYHTEPLTVSKLPDAHNGGSYNTALNYYSKNILNNGISVINVSGQKLGVTTTINLNEYVEGGIYFISDSRLTIVNGPNGMTKGYLIVIEWSSTEVRQIFIENNSNSEKTFIRGRSGSNTWTAWKEILTSENTIIKSGSINFRANCWNAVGTKDNKNFVVRYYTFFREADNEYVNMNGASFTEDKVNKKPVWSGYKLLTGVTLKGWRGFGYVNFETPFPNGVIPSVSLNLTTSIGSDCAVEIGDVTNKGFSFSIDRMTSTPANHDVYWIATNKDNQSQYTFNTYTSISEASEKIGEVEEDNNDEMWG